MNSSPVLQVLLLAAGNSTRFGSDKRLLMLQPVLGNIFSALPDTECLCVLRASDKSRLHTLLGIYQHNPRLHIVWNAEPERGMGHSLALAAQQLHAEAAMVLLADMPYVQASTLKLLAEKCSASTIVAPLYAGQRGHPVVFGKTFFAELQQLKGDSGARQVLQKNHPVVQQLDVNDAGVLLDVDTPQACFLPINS